MEEGDKILQGKLDVMEMLIAKKLISMDQPDLLEKLKMRGGPQRKSINKAQRAILEQKEGREND